MANAGKEDTIELASNIELYGASNDESVAIGLGKGIGSDSFGGGKMLYYVEGADSGASMCPYGVFRTQVLSTGDYPSLTTSGMLALALALAHALRIKYMQNVSKYLDAHVLGGRGATRVVRRASGHARGYSVLCRWLYVMDV